MSVLGLWSHFPEALKTKTKQNKKISGPNSTILALSPAFSQRGIKNWHRQQLCISPGSVWVFLSFFGFVTNGSVAFPGSNKTPWWVLDYIHSKRAPCQSSSGLCCPQPLAMNVRAKVSGYTHHWNQTHLHHMRNRLEGGIQHLSPKDKGIIALQLFPVFMFNDSTTHSLPLTLETARIFQQHWPAPKRKEQAAKESNQVLGMFSPKEVEQVSIQRLINPSQYISLLNSSSQVPYYYSPHVWIMERLDHCIHQGKETLCILKSTLKRALSLCDAILHWVLLIAKCTALAWNSRIWRIV